MRASQLVDLYAIALQQGLFKLKLQSRPVVRINKGWKISELVIRLEGDTGNTTCRQWFQDGGVQRRIQGFDRVQTT